MYLQNIFVHTSIKIINSLLKPNEVRMVGVHIGQFNVHHQLHLFLTILLLVPQETC